MYIREWLLANQKNGLDVVLAAAKGRPLDEGIRGSEVAPEVFLREGLRVVRCPWHVEFPREGLIIGGEKRLWWSILLL